MISTIDTSLWIDYLRPDSSASLRQFIAERTFEENAHLIEPVAFELLRAASPREVKILSQHFSTYPKLPTPPHLWTSATELGQKCRKVGVSPAPFDLLIASIAIHHDATLVTFDEDFIGIAKASRLRVELLKRPD